MWGESGVGVWVFEGREYGVVMVGVIGEGEGESRGGFGEGKLEMVFDEKRLVGVE